jgi:hypothetical protein
MAGFLQNPLQFVNLIRDNLSDRYLSGFPVLKELIQNTDDAKATHLDFGLVPGIPDADHPLLGGSGLFLINNGEFRESDARGIRSFGLNSKAADNSSIGKFGLGMKSVFHFCEAFFFLAHDGEKEYREILNPWSGPDPETSLHSDWDRFSEADARRIRERLTNVLEAGKQSPASFVLWLPLRMRTHLMQSNGVEGGAIVSEFVGDDSSHLDFLLYPDLPAHFAQLLPLLGYLREIRFWDCHKSSNKPEFELSLSPDEQRRQLLQQVELSADQHPSSPVSLSGKVDYRHHDEKSASLVFAGREAYGWNDALQSMHADELWPSSNVSDQYGHPAVAKDKARPHGAVFFARQPGKGTLTAQWAVFLPLDENTVAESVRCDGEFDFQLTLHGYFFIDAGRQGIDGQQKFGEEIEIGYASDKELKTAWNVQLARLQVLPLVLPALDDFCQAIKLDDRSVSALTKAIFGTSLWRKLSAVICQHHGWLRTIDATGVGWQLHNKPETVRGLPEPPQKQANRPWQVFPWLLENADATIFVVEGSPHLLDPEVNVQWQDTELIELFQEVNVSDVFVEQTKLDYFVRFCVESAGPNKNRGMVQAELRGLIRRALVAHGEKVLQLNRKMMQDLVPSLAEGSCLKLDSELPPTLLKSLLAADTDVLPLPAQFLGEGFQAANSIDIDDAIALLVRVGATLDEAGASYGELEKAALRTAEQIIQSVEVQARKSLLSRCKDLRVLPAEDCRQQRKMAVSARQLEMARDSGLLFGFSQGTSASERRGLAAIFQNSLATETVLLVNVETSNLVLGQGMQPCKGDAILASLGRHPHDLTGTHDRSALVKQVGAPVDAVARRGLRYLLHARQEKIESDETLWLLGYEQKPVWQKLWVIMNGGNRSPWNLVDATVAESISRGNWAAMGIREIKAETIQKELAENAFLVSSLDSKEFNQHACDELLSDIQDDELWLILPFHWSCHGLPVAAIGDNVYLGVGSGLDESLLENIHLIQPSSSIAELQRQKRLLKPLDEAGMLGVLLSAGSPAEYWREILQIVANGHHISDERLTERLLKTPWLPSESDFVFRPEQIIDLAENLDEMHKLYHRCQGQFCLPSRLMIQVRKHAAFEANCRPLFMRGARSLQQLSQILIHLPDYHIGSMPLDEPEGLRGLAGALGNGPHAGWRLISGLLEVTEEAQLVEHLLPSMCLKIEIDGQLELLNWLAESGGTSKAHIAAFNAYLALFAQEKDAASKLANLRLLSQGRKWTSAASLTAGVEGIAPSHVLDERQTSLLSALIYRPPRPVGGLSTRHDEPTDTRPEDTAKVLGRYFETWNGKVMDPLLASLVVLMGREESTRRLAEQYLGNHTLEWLIGQFPWEIPTTSVDGPRTWLNNYSLEKALKEYSIAVSVFAEDDTRVESILGDTIPVTLDKNIKTLFIGRHSVEKDINGGFLVNLVLRKFDAADHSDVDLANIIKQSVRYLLRALYNQPKPMLDSLLEELDKSDQVDIELARALILDNIPFYLKQLGAHKHPELKESLDAYDISRKKVAEFKGTDREKVLKVEQNQRLELVQRLLECNESVQESVLNAIRNKIRDYQYQTTSIPFEVFQNADDAVKNLYELESWPSSPDDPGVEPLPASLLKFVVNIESNRVTFMHWGRAINQVGHGGFPGRERRYDNDLENMVILSASDKGDGVTGKFGLGFKSVLLVSDAPEIVSGRLRTRVIGGLLPAVLEEKDTKDIQDQLRSNQSTRQLGTAISLPLRENVDLEFMRPFIQRAGVLASFSRMIRDVEIYHPDGSKLHAQWAPRPLTDCSGCSVGRVQLGPGVTQLVIKMDSEKGALLLAVGPEGFLELPDDLPNIWVTAPISESDHVGFAINGPFEIDAGRFRLAAGSSLNRNLGSELGKLLERLLGKMLSMEWSLLRSELQLAETTSPYQLWYSLWSVLLGRLPRIPHESAVRAIAQPLTEAALSGLSSSHDFVPNGFGGKLGCLLKTVEVRYVFRGALSELRLLHALGETEFFGKEMQVDRAISDEVATWLRIVSPEFRKCTDQWESISCSEFLTRISFREGISSVDASRLGRVFNRKTREIILEGGRLLLDDFDKSVKQLEKLKFQSLEGSWVSASQLLTIYGSEDEIRRCAFAPAASLLAEGYDEQGVEFFLLCRQGMEACSDMLVAWILDVESNVHKEAALRYLLKGELGAAVAGQLMVGGLSGTWISEVTTESPLLQQWNNDDKVELLYKVLKTSKELERFISGVGSLENPIAIIDPEIALEKIYRWWSEAQEEFLNSYEKAVYPRELVLELENDEDGRIDRSSWLCLLLLGGFHTLGRTRPEQHRSFIEDCQRRDWWRVFSEESPEEHFQEWMLVLEEFIEMQVDREDYEQWMMRFPVIYKLSRYLSDYAELLMGLDRYRTSFKLHTALNSMTDSAQQGGGIGAPALGKSLGIGANFVVRELLRRGILNNPVLFEHAFVPYKGVRDLMRDMGCEDLDPYASTANSSRIYDFITQHMKEAHVSFDGAWDIPLMLVAQKENWEIQESLLGRKITEWAEESDE